jgi:hypothetical protein
MKEKPIIFSSPMVKAILEDKKDMTRRVVKGPPCTDINGCVNIKGFWFIPERDGDHAFDGVAPYCVGDILWVRETWGIVSYDNNSGYEISVQYKADNKQSGIIDLDNEELWYRYITQENKWSRKNFKYCKLPKPDGCPHVLCIGCENNKFENPILWRPSIYLPRCAARIFLEVKHVRLEQIQAISEKDSVREGVSILSFVLPDEKTKLKPKGGTFRTEFKHLWDKLNAKRDYG